MTLKLSFTLLVALVSACDEPDAVDPLGLPSGIVYCADYGARADDPKPGHFYAIRDGQPIRGLASVVDRNNGLWRLDLSILHEGCYDIFRCSIGHFPLREGLLKSEFPTVVNECDHADAYRGLDFQSIDRVSMADVEDDVSLNRYNNDTVRSLSRLELTKVDTNVGYVQGKFELVLKLDTTCGNFRRYPPNTIVTDGMFTASLHYY